MKLYVHVLEARDLPPATVEASAAGGEVWAKVKLGKYKSCTRGEPAGPNPAWKEEFMFRARDMDESLYVSVFVCGGGGGKGKGMGMGMGMGRGTGVFVGRVRVPVWMVVKEEDHVLQPTWFSLLPKRRKSKDKDAGKILIAISLNRRGKVNFGVCPSPASVETARVPNSHELANTVEKSQDFSIRKNTEVERTVSSQEGRHSVQAIAGRFMRKLLHKNDVTDSSQEASLTSTDIDSSELSNSVSEYESSTNEPLQSMNFEKALEIIEVKGEEFDMPENLDGGILLDQNYLMSPKSLNALLFAPDSQFIKDLAERQGTMDRQVGKWTMCSKDFASIRRDLTYIKAASKLVKAVRAFEEQVYLKADGKRYAVLTSVTTPDVPYGNCFKVELLFTIMPGPELPSGEESSCLVVSWNVKFIHHTIMKGMIESGVHQGLKESYAQFADLMAQYVQTVDSSFQSDKDNLLAAIQTEHPSDWELAVHYFWNTTVVSTILMCLYVMVHIFLSEPRTIQGLEFNGLDLPDSFGELLTGAILFLQIECVLNMISHFVGARIQKGSDHGVKAQGDGWLLTVALVEGENLTSNDSTALPDPYVVFTSNGKTRTSSVKLSTCNPQWNEILEFDAMEEPPSVLDVEVFNFDGPFDQASSLGNAEINFLRHTAEGLSDMWVPLQGKLAQASQARLHLRVFLDNSKGVETIKEYLTKMEKEVGKKLNLRSPQRNLTFQKIFGLPPEEFLVKDFSCYLRRKLPLQGRLYVSARIIGFYSNIFWNKTKFFLLWEDVEDIQVAPPSLASMGKPSLVIILRRDRGIDARHGAKSHDEDGRLIYHFQSFPSFGVASRTIMALWRTKTISPEQKSLLVDDVQEEVQEIEPDGDDESFSGGEDAYMSTIYSEEVLVNRNSLMEIFAGGHMERKIMAKVGCLNYCTTPWEAIKPDKYERHLNYRFSHFVSIFGGKVTSTQQRSPILDANGMEIDEVMTLHEIPFEDYFHIHLRYVIVDHSSNSKSCHCDVSVGVKWVKSTKFRERIGRNICKKFSNRMKEIFDIAEEEYISSKPEDNI